MEQGRVDNPSGFAPPEGTAALVLGSDRAGFFRNFKVGDKIEVFQSDAPGAAEKIVKIATRVRGPAKMPALTSLSETFGLTDLQTLTLKIDEGSQQQIIFNTADFVDIANATAPEVAAAINAQIIGGTAQINGEGKVFIHSDKPGRFGRIEIIGGTGNPNLGFEELAWLATIELAGNPIASVELWPGRTFDFSEFSANLAAHGSPVEIRFVLEVIAK